MAASLTSRALARFRCLGDTCPDTCCRVWRIDIDRDSHARLSYAMSGSAEERADFAAGVELQAENADPSRYAVMRLEGARSTCTFLTPDQLCGLHMRYGEAALPDLCASYPRVAARGTTSAELSGHLSCPELARLSLLAEDSMDLGPAPPELAMAAHQRLRLPAADDSDYEAKQDVVHAAVRTILARREQPLAVRLSVLALLGRATKSFFYRGLPEVEVERLQRTLDDVSSATFAARVAAELARTTPFELGVADLVGQLVVAGLTRTRQVGFLELLQQSLASYGDAGRIIEGTSEEPAHLPTGALWAAYSARRAGWTTAAPGTATRWPWIDLAFENHAHHHWLTRRYTATHDLYEQAKVLLLRHALLRFLVLGHPTLAAMAQADEASCRAAFEQVMVDVSYKLSRAVDHHDAFVTRFAAVAMADLDSWELVLALARA